MQELPNALPPLLYVCGCVKLNLKSCKLKGTYYLRKTTPVNTLCPVCKEERRTEVTNIQNTLDLMYHGLEYSGGEDNGNV